MLRLETNEGPKPSIYLLYDGLVSLGPARVGLGYRRVILDILHELRRRDPDVEARFLARLRKAGMAEVSIQFQDYVSYGIGGGDATAEFSFGTYLLFYVEKDRPFRGWEGPGLALIRAPIIPAEVDLTAPYERLPLG